MGLFDRTQSPNTDTNDITVISEGMTIFGEIATKDNVYINGSFTGKIVAKGEVAVGPKGLVEGTVQAACLRIAGAVDGNVECNHLVVLPTGKIYGQLRTGTIEIHPGGFLDVENQSQSMPVEPTAPSSQETPASNVTTLPVNGRESPWALKKLQHSTYRNARNANAAASRSDKSEKPTAPPNTSSADDQKSSITASTSNGETRWYATKFRREAS